MIPSLPRSRRPGGLSAWQSVVLVMVALVMVPGPVAHASEQNYVDYAVTISLSGTDFQDDEFGGAIALLTDTNSDGIMDLAVGAPDHGLVEDTDDGGYVMYSGVGLLTLFTLKETGMWKRYRFFTGDDFGLGSGCAFASAVATVRDLDGDSYVELAVGAPGENTVVFMFLTSRGLLSNYSVVEASDVPAVGSDAVSFGSALATGVLVNGTDFDVAVGDPEYDSDDGVVVLLNLTAKIGPRQEAKVLSSWKVGPAAAGLDGEGARFGAAAAVLPDLDGNGANELLVGAPYYDDDAGAVALLFMQPGSTHVQSHVLLTPDNLSSSLSSASQFGASVSYVSQQDNDTVVVAVGAPYDSTIKNNAGAVLMLYVNGNGEIEFDFKISDLSDVSGSGASSVTAKRYFGAAVAGMQDVDNDGFDDVFVGSPGSGSCGAFTELFMGQIYTDDAYIVPSPTPNPRVRRVPRAATAGPEGCRGVLAVQREGEVLAVQREGRRGGRSFTFGLRCGGCVQTNHPGSASETLTHLILAALAFWSITSCCYVVFRVTVRSGEIAQPGPRAGPTRGGLASDAISALTVTHYSSKHGGDEDECDTCAVCLSEFNGGDAVKNLPCGHFYHPRCIDEWLQMSSKCPLCQQHVFTATNLTESDARADGGGGGGSGGGDGGSGGGGGGGSVEEDELRPGRGRSDDSLRSAHRLRPPSRRLITAGGHGAAYTSPTEIEMSELGTDELRQSGVLVLEGQIEHDQEPAGEPLGEGGRRRHAEMAAEGGRYTALGVDVDVELPPLASPDEAEFAPLAVVSPTAASAAL